MPSELGRHAFFMEETGSLAGRTEHISTGISHGILENGNIDVRSCMLMKLKTQVNTPQTIPVFDNSWISLMSSITVYSPQKHPLLTPESPTV